MRPIRLRKKHRRGDSWLVAEMIMEANELRALLQEKTIHYRDLNDALRSEQDRAQRYAKEITEIKVALNQVAVYEGLVDVSPTARLVSELVRDHEELEARIDAALHYISTLNSTPLNHGETPKVAFEVLVEVADLLRGAQRIPDTLEGFDG